MKSKQFPKKYLNLITKFSLAIAVFAVFTVLSTSVNAQRTLGRIGMTRTISTSSTPTKTVLLAESANLDQCANGTSDATHVPCAGDGSGNDGWVNGNVNGNKAHWAETEVLSYRMRFGGLTTGAANPHTVTIGYDIFKSSKHALDYLSSFDNTETQGGPGVGLGNNPCDTVPGCDLGVFTTFDIPVDSTISGNPLVLAARAALPNGNHMTLYGGTITNVSVPFAGSNSEEMRVTVTFTADVANPVLAWGAHIAWQGEWGIGQSAGAINGSPYHMRLIELDGSGGNQDRQLSADAVAIPAKVTIVKKVNFSLSNSPTVSFSFTPTLLDFAGITFNATGTCPDICLSPVTDAGGLTSSAAFTFPAITNSLSGLAQDARTVQESVNPPQGWKVTNLGCANTGPGGAASFTVSSASDIAAGIAVATVRPVEADDITCTFTNSVVTAANANISGRITTATGYGIRGAMITVQDVTKGTSTIVLTNSFGYYTVSNLPVNDFYFMTVSARSYTFSNSTQSFTLLDNLSGLNFVADPK